jgi:hypothetical protein
VYCTESRIRALLRDVAPTEPEPDPGTIEAVDQLIGLTIARLAGGVPPDTIVAGFMSAARRNAVGAGLDPDGRTYETTMAMAARLVPALVGLAGPSSRAGG